MASSEYISREALKELFDGIYDCADLVFEPDDQICAKQHSSCGSCRWIETKRAIQKSVMSIPAADVRPVVLCRDCKYWEISKIEPPFHVCTYVCGATFVRSAGDFCSRGEKREDS